MGWEDMMSINNPCHSRLGTLIYKHIFLLTHQDTFYKDKIMMIIEYLSE